VPSKLINITEHNSVQTILKKPEKLSHLIVIQKQLLLVFLFPRKK